jgi:hypothetical protein
MKAKQVRFAMETPTFSARTLRLLLSPTFRRILAILALVFGTAMTNLALGSETQGRVNTKLK